MFRFTQEPSSGSQSQCLAKITGTVPLRLLCHRSTDNIHIKKHSGTIPAILARHWLCLPDDGSCVNRNMSERHL